MCGVFVCVFACVRVVYVCSRVEGTRTCMAVTQGYVCVFACVRVVHVRARVEGTRACMEMTQGYVPCTLAQSNKLFVK